MSKPATPSKLSNLIGCLYNVKDVSEGYKFWYMIFFNKCINLFQYDGLPDSLPAEEIELRMIKNGFCPIFKVPAIGLVTCSGGLSGVDKYYHPTKYVYAQPVLGSGNLDISKTCVIMYNSILESYSTQVGILSTMIRRYARLMADVESSVDTYTINTRVTYINTVKNDQVKKSVDLANQTLEAGYTPTVQEDNILECYRTLPYSGQQPTGTLDSLITARKNIMKSFLSEIGIRYAGTKKERMITEEAEDDRQVLVINSKNMLAYRTKGIKQVNEMFGTSISVKLNPDYEVMDNAASDGVSGTDAGVSGRDTGDI